jgi:hypothetical protein
LRVIGTLHPRHIVAIMTICLVSKGSGAEGHRARATDTPALAVAGHTSIEVGALGMLAIDRGHSARAASTKATPRPRPQ